MAVVTRECVSPAEQQSRAEYIRQLAEKIEQSVHQQATSQEQYYQLLAEKIYKLKKAKEDRTRQVWDAECGCMHAYIHMRACLRACLPACLLACLPACVDSP